MEDKKPKDLKLKYSHADVTNLKDKYGDGFFQVAVDKGTLDAIAVDDTEPTI